MLLRRREDYFRTQTFFFVVKIRGKGISLFDGYRAQIIVNTIYDFIEASTFSLQLQSINKGYQISNLLLRFKEDDSQNQVK